MGQNVLWEKCLKIIGCEGNFGDSFSGALSLTSGINIRFPRENSDSYLPMVDCMCLYSFGYNVDILT